MSRWDNEQQARDEIKNLVTEYYHQFQQNKKTFAVPVISMPVSAVAV